ncbi:hypothetical protein KDH_25470 [Dictyobacter sp. S3.2.2.5]|uniref:N-acetyltransferase domain-containing protein n=1 Tax=Dictyobacter halimunensis TaxID=3026934 RepID=A0ABQ6FQ48_9CHLR|nr:hypothetical protein KDH_25470 [Dictyobacter sp. S3.2.2.5]
MSNKQQANDEIDQHVIQIEPWGKDDLDILKKTLGNPETTRYLGGPESDEQLARRQVRYERLTDEGKGRMFKIVHVATGKAVGSVGYWDTSHNGEDIYEAGWLVVPAFQGKGIASKATALAIAQARLDGKYRFLHAFPSVENQPSNAVCRKLGLTLIEECEFEYPKGHFMRCNDWCIDLSVDNSKLA